MDGASVEARLLAARPPDLLPEHRLDHKVDMSAEAIARRLAQVQELRRLGAFLAEVGARLPDAAPNPPPASR